MTLAGPTSLQAGATGQYTLTITGGAGNAGGFNVATDNGATLQRGSTDQWLYLGELTHLTPGNLSSGKLVYNFSLVAPKSGSVRIYAAGMAANRDGTSTGDATSTTIMSVAVGGSGGSGSSTGGGSGNGATGSNFGNSDISIEPKTGCSATGGASLSLLPLAAASLLRRRRS